MIFDRKYLVGLLVGGVLGVSAAFAPVVAQQVHSEEHLEYTREVMKNLGVFSSFDQIIPSMAEQARTLYLRNSPAFSAEIDEATTNAAIALVERRKELDDKVVAIWADRFSFEDIRAIAEFFNSNAGKSFAAQSGVLLQESAVAAKEWGDVISVDIMDMVRKELEEKTDILKK